MMTPQKNAGPAHLGAKQKTKEKDKKNERTFGKRAGKQKGYG